MQRKKWFLWGTVALALIFAGWAIASPGKKAATPAYKTAPVTRGNLEVTVAATGTVSPVKQVNISAKITGIIQEVYVEENQPVKAGDVLLILDDLNYRAGVDQARADVARAEANLAQLTRGARSQERLQAESNVNRAKARRDNAAANLERYRELARVGAVSQQSLDTAQTDFNVAEAEYQAAVQQLSMVQEGARSEEIAMAQAQLAQARAVLVKAEAQLADTVIKTPIDGVVVGKPLPRGQAVSPGISTPMVLMTVADLSQMEVSVMVDETDISKVTIGQQAEFTVDAYPEKVFRGPVTRISSQATVQQNVVYYPVTLLVDNREGFLKPTMTARVTIKAQSRENVLYVPNGAIRDRGGAKFVQVLESGQPKAVPVSVGISNAEFTDIVSGVQEGTMVLVGAPPPDKAAGARNSRGFSIRRLFGR